LWSALRTLYSPEILKEFAVLLTIT